MIKLTKAQRDQLISVVAGTVVLLGVLYYFGVAAKQAELAGTKKQSADMLKKLHDADSLMRKQEEIETTLQARSNRLAKIEGGLAPDRDAYAWFINTMNNFKQSRKGVTIDSFSQPEVSEDGLIPHFPYRWATFHLRGTGYYYDIGKFFADFETEYPYFRIQGPVLSANAAPGTEPEKLSLSFDVIAPVAPAPDIK